MSPIATLRRVHAQFVDMMEVGRTGRGTRHPNRSRPAPGAETGPQRARR